MIRCNMCWKHFENDDELEVLYDEAVGENYKGCSKCKTDEYLMDLEEVVV